MTALIAHACLGDTGGELVLLPMGAWTYLEQASPQMLIIESGVYWSDELRTVVSASYTDGAMPRHATRMSPGCAAEHSRARDGCICHVE